MLGIKICGMVDFISVVNTSLVVNSNGNEVICKKMFLASIKGEKKQYYKDFLSRRLEQRYAVKANCLHAA